jgi:small subunit ribosomal protein S20
MRTHLREVEEAIAGGNRAAATTALKTAEPELMRAAQKGVIHKRTASRKVSRLTAQIGKLAK